MGTIKRFSILAAVIVASPAVALSAQSSSALAVSTRASSQTHAQAHAVSARPVGTGPVINAHRGASGYRPEHTFGAYELAAEMGADYIEPDLVMTKDGVLVDRHEPEIGGTTDVAQHPEFAERKTTKMVDGTAMTGWFTEDFTLAELKSLRAVERLPELRQHNTLYNGRWQIPTFEEVLQWREQLSREQRRTIGIIPEIKHSTYFHAAGLNPEAAFMKLVTKYGLNRPKAPLWVQSFEWTNLVQLRQQYRYRANSTFLATATGGPYDLTAAGSPRSYDDMLKASSLRELAKVVDGIAPDKSRVLPVTGSGELGAPTSLVDDAHSVGLQVTIWTLRAENNWQPPALRVGSNPADFGRALNEDLAFMKAGVDGVFCDQPDVCVEARKDFLAGR